MLLFPMSKRILNQQSIRKISHFVKRKLKEELNERISWLEVVSFFDRISPVEYSYI